MLHRLSQITATLVAINSAKLTCAWGSGSHPRRLDCSVALCGYLAASVPVAEVVVQRYQNPLRLRGLSVAAVIQPFRSLATSSRYKKLLRRRPLSVKYSDRDFHSSGDDQVEPSTPDGREKYSLNILRPPGCPTFLPACRHAAELPASCGVCDQHAPNLSLPTASLSDLPSSIGFPPT